MRIILDTNVLLSALLFGGKSRVAYDMCVETQHIFTSEWQLQEFYQKLEHKFKIDSITLKNIDNTMRNVFDIVAPNTPFPTICRDLDDNNILQLAETAKVDYIITGDKDLLVLKTFLETVILSPSDFLVLYNM